MFGTLRRHLFGLGPRDIAAVTRHFDTSPARARLHAIVESFAEGYNLGLVEDLPGLAAGLDAHDPERQGFAYEGAGMALGIRSILWPGSLLADFLRGPADRHHYITQVGAGWAMARVPLRHGAVRAQLDPSFHWLAWDGWGFHEAIFATEATLGRGKGRPATGHAGRCFDNGVGRALWFIGGTDPAAVSARIAALPEARHEDLWGGVGLAATYANGVPDDVLRTLVAHAGRHAAALGVGSLLATLTRERAGNATDATQRAALLLTGRSAEEGAAEVRAVLDSLPDGDQKYPVCRDILTARLHGAAAA